ncbi:sulfite exporter TauE/SafE family protein [Filibacter tadaridae]|uniref:Probable membrane transporter protein n=1 Tax=Filibacter tadaridae TaxID=2483811 RepID=A0A3P5WSR3_9BACL|nr:sulfite exporter TauE/SafE family protein [Filibacter tadaridae]VDC21646.1 Sulfite exporter TauE/SafE [Filibacter tadaridae]
MTVFIFIAIILIASILQTSTGFGFSILATPFLLMIFEPREAIQINLVLSLVISAALIVNIHKDVDAGILKRLIIGSLPGLPLGLIIFLMADIGKLKISIGIVLLVLTVLLILNFRFKKSKGRDYIVGGLSGAFTTGIGMPGPPLLLYFSGTDTQKETLRATTLAFYLFIYSISLAIQMVFVGTNKTIWTSSGLALPLVVVGLFLGQRLFHHINQKHFRVFTYCILIVTGVYLFIQ